MKVKKIVLVLLCLVMLVSMTACSSSGVDKEVYDAVVAERDALSLERDQLETKVQSLEKEIEELKDEVDRIKGQGNYGENESGSENSSKDEDESILVYSDDYVEIRFLHCEKKYTFYDGWDAVFLVKNKTSASLTIGTNYLSINGKSLSDAFGFEEIAPNSTGKFCVGTEEFDGKTINKLSGSFYVADRNKKLGWDSMMYDAEFSVG